MPRQAFKQKDQEVIGFYARSSAIPIPGVPKFDNRRIVDGQRLIIFHKPLPPLSEGRDFELKTRVIGVYDRGKAGSVVETETILSEKGGGDYTKTIGSAFFVGQGDWAVQKVPHCQLRFLSHHLIVQQVQIHPTSHHPKTRSLMFYMLLKQTENLPISTGTLTPALLSHLPSDIK